MVFFLDYSIEKRKWQGNLPCHFKFSLVIPPRPAYYNHFGEKTENKNDVTFSNGVDSEYTTVIPNNVSH